MAGLFEKGFNKFAEYGNLVNKGINKVVGKEVVGEIKKMESPKEFPSLDSFPKYLFPEPEQWTQQVGEEKVFSLDESTICVSSNLDSCLKYRKFFVSSAEYYTSQFKFRYQNCINDFDSLIHYFSEIYLEGLSAMAKRAYSLLLPFGVFSANVENFITQHIDNYHKAIDSYDTMANIEKSRNQASANLGNQIGNAVQMQGGGFGIKGAMKGVAQAEAFNLGMGMLGKYMENQTKMSKEEKAKIFAEFKEDIFFQEVYSDYYNTFLTLVQTLADNGVLDGTTTIVNDEYNTILQNLQNPMFPQDRFATAISKLISSNPFVPVCYELLKQKYGETEEVYQIINYFNM